MSSSSTKLYDKIVTCIKKTSDERTTVEIEEIYPWFIEKVKFFSNLKHDVVKDIIKNCEFSERETDDIIIRQFEEGDCFYIILSGRVSIYVNTELVHDDQEVVHQQDDSIPTVKHSVGRKATNRENFGNYAISLGTGDSFGELALINKDCIRNATVIADCTTHLAVINRITYNRSLRDVHEADFKRRINFISKCPHFNGWIQSLKKQAAMSLVQTDFPFEADLVRQEEPLKGLMFIISGQAQISIDILKHPKQYPDLKLPTYSIPLTKMNDHRLIHTENPNYPVRRMGYIVKEKRNALKKIELCIAGPGTVLGEFEYGFGLKTYMETATCIEPITAYVFGARNFERLIQSRRNPDGLRQIREIAQRNIMYRISRTLDSKIPLFRFLVKNIYEANLHLQEEKREKALANLNKAESKRTRTLSKLTSRNQQQRMKRNIKPQLQQNELAFQTRRQQVKKLQNNILTLRAGRYSVVQQQERNINPDNGEFNEPVTDRSSHNQLDEKLPSLCLHDWETSSENISRIESKLKRWHYEVDMLYEGKIPIGNRISPLKSCEQITQIKQILPGKQIFIRIMNNDDSDDNPKQLETNEIVTDNATNNVCKSVRFENGTHTIDPSKVSMNQNDEVINLNQVEVAITTENNFDTTSDELAVNESEQECEFESKKAKIEASENASEKNQTIANEVKLILGRIRPVSSSYGYISTNRLCMPSRNIKSARTDEIKGSASRRSTMASSLLSPKHTVDSYTMIKEYRELRSQLRKQENEMHNFRVSLLL
ncbi:cAMP-dependent protein kinase regulatory subunit [Schistosoma japonicum]|uniref:cAMP-dependent protein kinase regulatory subunit n=1 Tax=Schistosoma japonicum TaxID=6182 RepID=A0A4Z2CTI0_SCHJA|nr:cAMP-dependent protein kinase regulatory subunit [Schistosoma japonicum]